MNQITDLNLASVIDASRRISCIAVETPLKPSFELSRRTGGQVFLKMENMQDTGSFKVRGATNAILSARDRANIDGVVAVSSGNHGKAVAYVAKRLGIAAVICMAEHVPKDKIQGIREFGAEVVIHGKDQNEAVEAALQVSDERSYEYIPPFDDPLVIAAQGTVGLEMLQQQPNLNLLIVPVSGGGLLSGVALAARAIKPDIEIVGVTSHRDAALYESIKAGKVVVVDERPSVADALPGPIPLDNRYTFEMCRDLVDEIVPIPEERIAAAMRYCLDYEQVVLEGAGAASIAYVLENQELSGKKVAAVCSGNNISKERLAAIFEDFGLS
jgi:threonine dehydratase